MLSDHLKIKSLCVYLSLINSNSEFNFRNKQIRHISKAKCTEHLCSMGKNPLYLKSKDYPNFQNITAFTSSDVAGLFTSF